MRKQSPSVPGLDFAVFPSTLCRQALRIDLAGLVSWGIGDNFPGEVDSEVRTSRMKKDQTRMSAEGRGPICGDPGLYPQD